jgi:hypothetical protein
MDFSLCTDAWSDSRPDLPRLFEEFMGAFAGFCQRQIALILPFGFRLPVVGTLKRYSKALEYEYRVKTVALGTLKRYSILSLTLYLE